MPNSALKSIFSIIFLCLVLAAEAQDPQPRGCAVGRSAPEVPPGYAPAGSKLFEQWISKIQKEESDKGVQDSDELYTLPVVVHVLHFGEPVGEGRNLSDERIASQIQILNEDYGKLPNTPGFNTHPAGADTRIRFCLAAVDPNGQPTNGIVRINTNRDGFDLNSENTLLKSFSFWDPNKYLNIWVCKLLGNQYIGYAQYPMIQTSWVDSLPMPQPIPDVQPDGVVIEYRVFGNVPSGQSGPFPSYNKGRTATHEVGHYLGLLHIWGDGFGCDDPSATDHCSDTPKQATFTTGCPSTSTPSCEPGIPTMKENYLDYTNDVCMNIFTVEQKKRMRIVLRNAIRRKTLLINPVACNTTTDTQPPIPVIPQVKNIRFSYPDNNFYAGEVIVKAPDGESISSLVVFDYSGKTIQLPVSKDLTEYRVQSGSLARGIYFLRITTSDGQSLTCRFGKR